MKTWELILLLSFLAVVVSYWRNRELGFGYWFFGRGLGKYLVNALIMLIFLIWGLNKLVVEIDWTVVGNFMNFKLW